MKKGFPFPMSKPESIVGWVWAFVHVFALSYILYALYTYVLADMGVKYTDSSFNLVYYAVSFVFLLVFLFNYLRTSFRHLTSNFVDALSSIAIYYFIYRLSMYLISLLLSLVYPEISNPNQESINELVKLNKNMMIVVSVLLAPFVEEVIFRGVVFGTIRKKNTLIAYIVSSLFFAFYHEWQFFLTGFSWSLLITTLTYIPAGICLARTYERSKTIWAPIFLHMILNFVSVTVQFGL